MSVSSLEQQGGMSKRQIYVIAVSAAAQMIDFLDFFLISFVLAYVAKPWHLTTDAKHRPARAGLVPPVRRRALADRIAGNVGAGLPLPGRMAARHRAGLRALGIRDPRQELRGDRGGGHQAEQQRHDTERRC